MTSTKKPFTAAEIRSAFLDYFARQGHSVIASSSLVPGNDPTLLFTNAGMVQFKDVFTGKDPRPYVRATSSQRCVRAGGKHNDLENVGYTARHHTFFEMLGNFSFGDYFKRDAIRFAWDFLTNTLGIDPRRLWVTVYEDDDEAEQLWIKEAGVPANRVTRLGESSNFWSMGDTGPCGPCTEIFYDHGADIPGGPPGSPDEDGDRYVEIWNLVFMQFDRAADGTTTPLPKPSVDTGMGLERICAVMQGVQSNYDIDLFKVLVGEAARLLGVKDLSSPSLRVIADHIRACSFLVADGVMPSNEGRGYVLRRIMRRAMRHGHKFGAAPTFFADLLPALVGVMGEAYPVLRERQAFIRDVLLREGEQFARTLANGMTLLEEAIAKLKGSRKVDGEVAFRLYDTYGFPVDLTADIARERGLELDQAGFEVAMDAQRERARAASRFGVDTARRHRAGCRYRFLRLRARLRRESCRGAAQGRRCGRRAGARRRGRSGARAHAVLRRVRRAGRRHRRAGGRQGAVCRERHPQARRRVLAPGSAGRRPAEDRRQASPPRSTPPAASASAATTRRPTCCTLRCAKCWARTCSRRARWWPRTGCDSISRTSSP